jgi:hypothetical protein
MNVPPSRTSSAPAPADALGLINDYAPLLARELEAARKEKRAARLQFNDGHE